MGTTRPPTVGTFAGLYFARVILGIFIAFALQRAIIALISTGEFRAVELRIAVAEVLRKVYADYPPVHTTASNSDWTADPSRIPLPLALKQMTSSYKSISTAMAALPTIQLEPVVATQEAIGLLSNTATIVLATKLKLPVTSNESIAEMREKISQKVQDLDQRLRPTHREIQDQVRQLLEQEQQRRHWAAICLVVFLVIQPWHLFVALRGIQTLGWNGQVREGLDQPQTPRIIILFAIAAIVGVTLTYAAIIWGEAYSGSILPGLLWFLIFWMAFDGLRVMDDCWQAVWRDWVRSGNISPILLWESVQHGLRGVDLKQWLWIGIDIALLSLVYYQVGQIHVENVDTYAQLQNLRWTEIRLLLILVIINGGMIVWDVFAEDPLRQVTDRYISSLEKFSVLSEEDMTDSQYVAESIESRPDGVTWLDIGSGNLDKVVRVAQLLIRRNVEIKSIDCVEPHALWNQHQTNHSHLTTLQVHHIAWPGFIHQQGKGKQWSVITAIHSLYQFRVNRDGHVAQLEDIANCLTRPGQFIVVVEGPRSALLQAKRAVYSDIDGTLITEQNICATAKSLGWPDPIRKELDQRFFTDGRGLSHPYESPTDFPWFIFESDTSTNANAKVSYSVVRRVSTVLTECLKVTDQGRTFLDVGDVALVFRFGKV